MKLSEMSGRTEAGVLSELDSGKDEIPDNVADGTGTLYDKHGFPLVPQPSPYADDPLNWPAWKKWMVLLQISFLAMLGPFNSSTIVSDLSLM
jgi:hypothetical protein